MRGVLGLIVVFLSSTLYSQISVVDNYEFELVNNTGAVQIAYHAFVKVPLNSGIILNDTRSNFEVRESCNSTVAIPYFVDPDLISDADTLYFWLRVETFELGINTFYLVSDADAASTFDGSNFDLTFLPSEQTIYSTNDTISGDVINAWIEVQSGVTVTLTEDVATTFSGAKVRILGKIDGKGKGFAGGGIGAYGEGPGGGGPGSAVNQPTCLSSQGDSPGGGGGGSYGGRGVDGSDLTGANGSSGTFACDLPAMSAGLIYGKIDSFDNLGLYISKGSGGGGGDTYAGLGSGGNGGGAFTAIADQVYLGVSAEINVDGGDVDDGTSAGGGSGGGVALAGHNIYTEGAVLARRGIGKSENPASGPGGNGGGGRIKVIHEYNYFIDDALFDAANGSVYVNDTIDSLLFVYTGDPITQNFAKLSANLDITLNTLPLDNPHVFCTGQEVQFDVTSGFEDYTFVVQLSDGTFVETNHGTDNFYTTFMALGMVSVSERAVLGGCVYSSQTYPISVVAGPTVSSSGPSFVCADAPQVDFNGFPTGGTWSTDPVSGIIDGNGTIGSLSLKSLGGNVLDVTYTVTDPLCGEFAVTKQLIIGEVPVINSIARLDALGVAPFCPIDTLILKPEVTPLGSTITFTPGNIVELKGDDTLYVSTPVSSELEIIARSPEGCLSAPTLFPIEVVDMPLPSIDSLKMYCLDDEGDSLTVRFFQGATEVGKRPGLWSGPGILPQDEFEGVFRPEIAGVGIHTITFTYEEEGCVASDKQDFEVRASNTLGMQIPVDDPLCGGNKPFKIDIDVPGGFWYGEGFRENDSTSGIYSPEFVGEGKDTIVYIVENSCGRLDKLVRIIDVIGLPDASIKLQDPLCEDADPVSLEGVIRGGVWKGEGFSNADLGLFDPSLLPAGSQSYVYYTLTAAEGCTSTDSLLISILANPIADAGDDVRLCLDSVEYELGGVQSATGGAGGYTYMWEPYFMVSADSIEKPTTVMLTEAQEFNLVVIDQAGCVGRDAVRIELLGEMDINAGQDIAVCAGEFEPRGLGGSPTVQGGTAPFSYSWNPPLGLTDSKVSNPVLEGLVVDAYTLEIIDANGCIKYDTIAIEKRENPMPSLVNDKRMCLNDSIELASELQVYFGTAPYTYAWKPAKYLSDAEVANPKVSADYSQPFTLTVTDAHGCSGIDVVYLKVDSLLEVTLPEELDYCIDEELKVLGGDIEINQRQNPLQYQWEPSGMLDQSTVPTPIADISETTVFTLTVRDAVGCEGIDSVQVNVHIPPTIDIATEVAYCEGKSLTIGSLSGIMAGSTPGLSVQWEPALYLSDTRAFEPKVEGFTGQVLYTVMAIDARGCTAEEIVKVFETTGPTVDAGDGFQVCEGMSVTIGGSPTIRGGALPYMIDWTGDEDLSNDDVFNPSATPSASKVYYVFVTDANGCPGEASVYVEVLPSPYIELEENYSICLGDSLELYPDVIRSGVGMLSFSWDPNIIDGYISNNGVIVSPEKDQGYTLTVTDSNECRSTAFTSIEVNPLPTVNLRKERKSELEYAFDGSASGITGYVWSFSDGSPVQYGAQVTHTFPRAGTYEVCLEVITPENCSDKSCELITTTTTTGIEDHMSQVVLYPNPTNNAITVEGVEDGSEVEIYTVNGQLMHQMKTQGNLVTLDVSSYANGLYAIHIKSQDFPKVVKQFIKK